MADEETIPSVVPNISSVESEELSQSRDAQKLKIAQGKLQKKLRIGETEDVLLTRRCSIFAFGPMYLVGIGILIVHLFFDWASAPDDAKWYETIFYFFVNLTGYANGFGFAFVMLFFTWLNRIWNHPASGRWVTSYLLLVAITPLVVNFDTFLANLPFGLGTEDEFIPFGYDIATAGIIYSSLFIIITFIYQKSFLYAVTTERIIHYQWFLYERDAHRVLHEDIVKIHTHRSALGAIFGYNTIYCDIGDGSHLVSESVGGGVALLGSSISNSGSGGSKRGIIGMIRSMVFFATFQRTIKTERMTPDQSFYGIRKWEEAFDLINKLQHENSTATKQDQQLEALQNIQQMLNKNPEAVDDDLNDLLSDI